MVDSSDPKGLPFHVRVDGMNLPDDGFAQVKNLSSLPKKRSLKNRSLESVEPCRRSAVPCRGSAVSSFSMGTFPQDAWAELPASNSSFLLVTKRAGKTGFAGRGQPRVGCRGGVAGQICPRGLMI